MLAWNWALTDRSGRKASGVSSSTSSAVWYPRWPYSSRSPTSTATRAVATEAASSSTSADRNATRSADMVVARYSPVTFPITSSCTLARPKILRVGRPSTTSRKCPARVASSRHCRCVRALVCQPTSTANSGISGSVTAMMSAEIQSAAATRASTAMGTATARISCGT